MTIKNRYPNADILAQRGHWDEATRTIVLDRVHNVPRYRNFNPHQIATLEALCARVIPQEDLPPDRRVPIAPWIDQQYGSGSGGGFRYEDMPGLRESWEWGLAGLDETARALFDVDFADLAPARQVDVLEAVRHGDPPGVTWQRMPARRWWITIALRQITGTYYAHPYAWDQIGFGGPAYPRGYFALNHGAPEPWEPREAGNTDKK
jgi:hypothetical protein